MVERRIQPSRRAVARVAGLGKIGRDVIGICRPLEVLQVAGHARCTRQVVIVVDVAIGAHPRRHRVQSCQRKSRRRVIELAVGPEHRVVALLACGRKTGMRHRRRRIVVIGLVATDARRVGDAVVVVDVAIGAPSRRHRVRARQRKRRLRVIECRWLPGRRRMAQLAGLREAARHMIRIRRSLEVFQVARHARRTGQVVVAVDVAIGALPRRHCVRAGQCEVDHRVIECRRRPGHRRMALLTSRREVRCHVIRIRRPLEIFQVARNASVAAQVVVVVDVAVRTLPRRHRVTARQGKSHRRVIEFRVQPIVGPMAGIAGGRELGRDVIRICCRCEICLMAGIASRRHRLEFAARRSLMTGIAIYRRVRSRQREPVVMLLDLLNGNLPAAHRMALLAICSQLPLVNVGMAVLAALPHVREHRLDVALHARHRLVHSSQRILRSVVIEFWNRANRTPSVRGVAILARHVQISMWAVRSSGDLRPRSTGEAGKRQEQHHYQIEYAPRRRHDSPLA